MQFTIASKVAFEGVGLHSGKRAKMVVHPAEANFGIWFLRGDEKQRNSLIRASYINVVDKPLCTRLINEDGVSVSTVEHVMAALAGCGVQNAIVELDTEEVPILDGCAENFVKEILRVGLKTLEVKQLALEILETIEVKHNDAEVSLAPSESLEIEFEIDFDEKIIGKQFKSLNMANGAFVHELASSRTFCRQADITEMHSKGLALGGNYDNAIVFDKDVVLSPGGLRYRDEAVRHKMLDALGDLALAGMPIIGRFRGIRAGHQATHKLLTKLFSSSNYYRIIECSPAQLESLPGAGLDKAGSGVLRVSH
ncbi:MAG: UDP-3-O-acyl-N-acetylglucosamine deacetylase [Proteobacteria bacterium]|nr:UDP-3-O-acyl-N-acetylglucosamine deacetylase [Pseudomonadota bacterium]